MFGSRGIYPFEFAFFVRVTPAPFPEAKVTEIKTAPLGLSAVFILPFHSFHSPLAAEVRSFLECMKEH